MSTVPYVTLDSAIFFLEVWGDSLLASVLLIIITNAMQF